MKKMFCPVCGGTVPYSGCLRRQLQRAFQPRFLFCQHILRCSRAHLLLRLTALPLRITC